MVLLKVLGVKIITTLRSPRADFTSSRVLSFLLILYKSLLAETSFTKYAISRRMRRHGEQHGLHDSTVTLNLCLVAPGCCQLCF